MYYFVCKVAYFPVSGNFESTKLRASILHSNDWSRWYYSVLLSQAQSRSHMLSRRWRRLVTTKIGTAASTVTMQNAIVAISDMS